MRKYILFLSFTLLSVAVDAQRTYLGFNSGIANDIYEFSDWGDKLKPIPLITGFWGFTFGQEFNDHFIIETGITRKYYNSGFGFKTDLLIKGFSSNGYNSWQIPIKVKFRQNLYKDKIFFITGIGYHYCINSDYTSSGWGGGSMSRPGGDSISFNHSDHMLAKRFSLLETDGGIEFKLFKKAIFSLSASYFTGFRQVMGTDINYTYNNDPAKVAKAHSKGEYWSVNTRLAYPISDIWKKK